MSVHVYSLAVDFPNNSLNPPLFLVDCDIAGIGNDDGFLITGDVDADTVTLTFTPNLTAGQITTLNGVVAAHLGLTGLGVEKDGWKTLTYTGGLLTKVETYKDSGRTDLSLTKDLTYNTDNVLTTVVATNDDTGGTLTKTLTYDSSGQLTAVDPS